MKHTKLNFFLVFFVFTSFTCVPEIEITAIQQSPLITKEIKVSTDDTIFINVDHPPEFEGGNTFFFNFIQENLKYPAAAKAKGIEGKVFVEFVVTKYGKIEDVIILKGIGAGCDKAALEIIKSSPDWIPGIRNDKAVHVKMIIPIMFKLN